MVLPKIKIKDWLTLFLYFSFIMMGVNVNKFFKIILPATALSLSVGGANAADLLFDHPQPAMPYAAGFDWSGFYAGIFAGYGAGGATSTGVATGSVSPVDVEGLLLGGTLGANAQFGSFVLGLEGDLAWSGVEGSATCAGAPAFDCNGSLDWLGTGKARAGVAFDRLLLFGTAGLAFGGITASTTPAAPGATGTFSSTIWGWTAGAGVEVAVTEAMSVKAEYAYHDFASVRAPVNTIANLGATDIKSHAHSVKLGLNYRF